MNLAEQFSSISLSWKVFWKDKKKNPSTPSSYKLMSTCLPSKGEVYVFLRFVWLVTIAEVKLNVHQGCHMEACCLCLIPLESSVLEF